MKPIIEEVEFTPKERLNFANKVLPIYSGEEEQLKSMSKTSRFQDKDPYEEYHVQLKNGDTLGFIKDNVTIDLDVNFQGQEKLITLFRQMSMDPLIDQCISHICDDAMCFNNVPNSDPMKLIPNIDNMEKLGIYSKTIEESLQICYKEVLSLLEFRDKGWEYFKQFYVDGKLYFELIFENMEREIKAVKLISPYNIVKVKTKDASFYLYDETKDQQMLKRQLTHDDHFVEDLNIPTVDYNTDPNTYRNKVKLIPEKYVVVVESSIKPFGFPLSPLYYARKSLNQLQLLQDSVVVYRISRAPERLVIYVDVEKARKADIPKMLADIAKSFKQKMVFDQRTGNVLDNRHVMATTENYFIPRYSSGATTNIEALKGGENLGKIEDVEYFQKNTYRALKVPLSRFGLGETSLVNIGNDYSAERDEITFSKYINRLRNQFNNLVWSLLQRQLIIKNIISSPSDFKILKSCLHLFYENENYYTELENNSKQQRKYSLLQQIEPLIDSGKISTYKAYKDTLGMSEQEVLAMFEEEYKFMLEKQKHLERMHEGLMVIAKLDSELVLAQNAELQFKYAELEFQTDYTKEVYGDDYTSPKISR